MLSSSFFFKNFISLFEREERETERACKHEQGREAEADGKAASPLSRDPDSGLNPRCQGS